MAQCNTPRHNHCNMCCGRIELPPSIGLDLINDCFGAHIGLVASPHLGQLAACFKLCHESCQVGLDECEVAAMQLELTLRAYQSSPMAMYLELAHLVNDYGRLAQAVTNHIEPILGPTFQLIPKSLTSTFMMKSLLGMLNVHVANYSRYVHFLAVLEQGLMKIVTQYAGSAGANSRATHATQHPAALSKAMRAYLHIYINQSIVINETSKTEQPTYAGFPSVIPTLDDSTFKSLMRENTAVEQVVCSDDLYTAASQLRAAVSTFMAFAHHTSRLCEHYHFCQSSNVGRLQRIDKRINEFADAAVAIVSQWTGLNTIGINPPSGIDIEITPMAFIEYLDNLTASLEARRCKLEAESHEYINNRYDPLLNHILGVGLGQCKRRKLAGESVTSSVDDSVRNEDDDDDESIELDSDVGYDGVGMGSDNDISSGDDTSSYTKIDE